MPQFSVFLEFLLLLFYSLLVFTAASAILVFYWSLNDYKFHKFSRTLLSFLAYLNNAVVCMMSTLLLISYSSNLFSNPRELFIVRQLFSVSPSHSCSTTFSALFQDPRIRLSFRFRSFSLCILLEQIKRSFFFPSINIKSDLLAEEWTTRLYIKGSENFMCLIL